MATSERSSRRLARRLFPLFRRAIERFFDWQGGETGKVREKVSGLEAIFGFSFASKRLFLFHR